VSNSYTAVSSGAIGPGVHSRAVRPRWTPWQASQSCRLVMSQKSTAYEGSKSSRCADVCGNAHVHSMRVAPGPSGVSLCVMT
jgi:hypothetical protein